MKKYVIYTCLVGSYDGLLEPLSINANFDYICFSNDIEEESIGVWRILKFDYRNTDPTRESRYPKIRPDLFLREYEYSVYIDSNLQIVDNSFYDAVLREIDNNSKISMVSHPKNNCIYQEAKECIFLWRDSYLKIRQNIMYLKEIAMPKNWGLYENNIILRKHNDKLIIEVDKEWWRIYNSFSRRDQLSFCGVLWQNNVKPNLLFPDGKNAHNLDCLRRLSHIKKRTLFWRIKLWLKRFVLRPVLQIIYPI